MFKKILILSTLLLVYNVSFSQKRDTSITWYSIPEYDSNGNALVRKKVFNHIPTRNDSIEFGKLYMREIEIAVQAAIDSLKKKNLIKEK